MYIGIPNIYIYIHILLPYYRYRCDEPCYMLHDYFAPCSRLFFKAWKDELSKHIVSLLPTNYNFIHAAMFTFLRAMGAQSYTWRLCKPHVKYPVKHIVSRWALVFVVQKTYLIPPVNSHCADTLNSYLVIRRLWRNPFTFAMQLLMPIPNRYLTNQYKITK